MRSLVFGMLLAVAASGCAPPAVEVAPGSGAQAARSGEDKFKPPYPVRVKSRSGTFKPDETGHTAEVNVSAGKTGTVLEIIGELARVRWNAQAWDEFPPTGAQPVTLKEFEATIHMSYLQRVD